MITQALPKKLKKEPIVDAVFEIRFSSSTMASTVMPGFFFAKLEPKEWKVEPLPVSQIPSHVRNPDPTLRYQPLMRIHWDNFLILIGDTTLGIACKMPYPGWIDFRERIIRVIGLLLDSKIVQAIERYSLKGVDIIECEKLADQIKMINMDIRVGGHALKEENFTVRLQIPYNDFLTIVQIAAPAEATMPDKKKKIGILVDIDTICDYQSNDLTKFKEELLHRLDAIHLETKRMFFDCLKPETIEYLEPVYE
jgi:uncharacterized protein (TIGR04255 family)